MFPTTLRWILEIRVGPIHLQNTDKNLPLSAISQFLAISTSVVRGEANLLYTVAFN